MKQNNHEFENSSHPDSGAALLGVVMLIIVLSITLFSILSTSGNGTILTADNRSAATSLMAADSGVDSALAKLGAGDCLPSDSSDEFGFDYQVFRSAGDTKPTGLDDPDVIAGCPQDGDRYVVIHSTGTDYRDKSTEVIATYQWVNKVLGSGDGALVSDGGYVSVSALAVVAVDGDVVLRKGDFNCDNNTRISGDVIVLAGSVTVSNACVIEGSIYASGNVRVQNAAVSVFGGVFTNGDFTLSSGSTIAGSVTAKGNLFLNSGSKVNGSVVGYGTATATLDNVKIGQALHTNGAVRLLSGSTIGGSLTASGTGDSEFYNVTIQGDVTVGGRFSQLAEANIAGSVTAAGAGQSAVAPNVVIRGSLHVRQAVSSWGAGPQVSGGVSIETTIAAPPVRTWTDVKELDMAGYPWRDYAYSESAWTTAGYTVVPFLNCNFQNSATLVSMVNNFTTPTLVDLTGCSSVNMYGVRFTLKTDVSFMANAVGNAEQVRADSSNATPHQFNLITFDKVADGKPTCVAPQGATDVYGVVMSDKITGMVYTPCSLKFGGGSVVNGQLYSGIANYNGGQTMTLNYQRVQLPGFPTGEPTGFDTETGYQSDATSRVVPVLVARFEP